MEKFKEILAEMDEAAREELENFFENHDAHCRERMSDNVMIYERLMQGIEELGEFCESYELLEDDEEKRRHRRSYSECLRTLSDLVQARGNLEKLMMLDE